MASILLCASSVALAGEKSNFRWTVPFGSYRVGFRVVEQRDYTRSFRRIDAEGNAIPGEDARPIQTLIWYPSRVTEKSEPMLYGRYLDLMATQDEFGLNENRRAEKLKAVLASDNIAKNYERERMQITHAYRDAPPEPGPFPAVIYAPSLSGSSVENADLCEFLASHGYIVLASPSMGQRSLGMTLDLKGIEAQVGDIEFLIGYLRSIPEADRTRIAVAGWSWGGMTNVFAAAQDSRISALISLDGGFRYQMTAMKEGETSGLVDPNRLTVPLLYFSSQPYSLEDLNRLPLKIDLSYSLLNELKYSDVYVVQTSEMIHPGFSSLFLRFREDQYFTDYTPEEFCRDYGWVAQYVVRFLNGYLKNETAALAYLRNEPEKNGVPRHLFAMDFRPATRPAANVVDFSRELAAKGFEKAVEIYEMAKKDDPDFKLSEKEVNRWGYELLREGKLAKAVAVFRLNVAMYPQSWNTYDSLGEAQEAADQKADAVANYRRSLELNSRNGHAAARLKELEASPK